MDGPKGTESPEFKGGGYATLPIVRTHSADDPRYLRYLKGAQNAPLFLPWLSNENEPKTPLLETPVTFETGPSSLPLNNGCSWVNFEGAWMLISKLNGPNDPRLPRATNYKMHSWLNYDPLIDVTVEVTENFGGLPSSEKIILSNFYNLNKASSDEVNLWSLFFLPQKLGVSLISENDVKAFRDEKPRGSSEEKANALFEAFAFVLFKKVDVLLLSRLSLSIPQLVRMAVETACPPQLLEDRYVQMRALTEYLHRMQLNDKYGAMKKFLRTKRGFKFLRFIQVDCATEKVLCRAHAAAGEPVDSWARDKLNNILEFGNDDPDAPKEYEEKYYLAQIAKMKIVSPIYVESDISKSYLTKAPTKMGHMDKGTAEYKINGMFKQIEGDPGYGIDTANLVATYGTVVGFFTEYWVYLRTQFDGLNSAVFNPIPESVKNLELKQLTPENFGLGPVNPDGSGPVETLQKGGLYRLMGPAISDTFGSMYFATLATAGSFVDWTRPSLST